MRLFLQIFLILVVFVGFNSIVSKAQNCSSPSIFFPDTVCLGQEIKGKNFGSSTSSYSWDVYGGDLFKTPTHTPISLTGLGSSYGLKVLKVNGKYYGFMASNSLNNLYRLDFDTNLTSTPTVVNLGNPGSSLNSPVGFEIEQDNGNYFGFTFNRNSGQLIRYQFGADITATPTSSIISVPGTLITYSIDIVKDGTNYFGFVAANNNTKMFVLSFGSSLISSPTINTITLPYGAYLAVSGAVDCSGRYIFISDYGPPVKIYKLRFENSFLETPSITSVSLNISITGRPSSITATMDGGRSLLFFGGYQTAGVGYLNFGKSYANDAPAQVSSLLSVPTGNVWGLSDVILKTNGESAMLYTTEAGGVGRITYPNGSPYFSGISNGYQPPVFNYSQPGKYFVNYRITDNLGNVSRSGDSIVVKSTIPSTSQGLDLDFLADEQCPSRTTKFYPQISPAVSGSYLWTYPGGSTGSSQTGSYLFPSTGTYLVSLYFRPTDGCGSGSITKPVRIFNNPTVNITSNFTLPPKICTKDSILFLDVSTPSSAVKRWKWDFGNGQTAFTKNGQAYYTSTNLAQVKLTASDSSGCGVHVSKPITPEAGANVEFSFSKVCHHDTTIFQNLTPATPGNSYLWTFGDLPSGSANTSTSSAAFVTHIFSDTSVFSIKLRAVNAIGCTSRVDKPLRVFPLPTVLFSFPAIAFSNAPIHFINQSKARYQTTSKSLWHFGDPGSGLSDTSTFTNPTHTFLATGFFPVRLDITTNKGCKSDTTLSVPIYPRCPQISYTKTGSASGDFDTTVIQNQTNLVKSNQIDFCAGDLELTPILQSQSTGSSPIQNSSQVVPIKDGNEWIGFIPAPYPPNATSFFKARFGNSLNNDISNFASDLGNPAGNFSNPNFIKFLKEDSVWYGIACNSDNKLYRLRFGSSLNNIPTVTPIQLPAGTLSSPTNAVLEQDRDSIYLFILNNNNAIVNNVIRLRFEQSVLDTPNVMVLANPPTLQNSTGFFSISLIRECDKWIGLLVSNSQLYRLNFGFSLNSIPSVNSISSEVTVLLPSPSVNVFNNLRGVNLLRDLGRVYALVNTNSGGIFRIRFGNGLLQPIDAVSSLGSFGISGLVGQLSFVQENSEVFGLGINNLGTIYKFKFPNHCSATNQFTSMTGPGLDTTRYLEAGKYYITITAESPFGTIVQQLDSVQIDEQNKARSCKSIGLNHKKPICFDYKINVSVQDPELSNVRWDFCTGDFKLTPANIALPLPLGQGVATTAQTVFDGNNYYSFVATQNGLLRYNLGNSPDGVLAQPVLVAIPPSSASGLQDFRFFKEGNNWFALGAFSTGESIMRLNFGLAITNSTPSASLINLSGLLVKCRAIELFEDHGNKYAMVANQDVNSVVLLDFGPSYINIPKTNSFFVPPAINLLRISMMRDCNLWHAFLSDEKVDSVFQLTFTKGLSSQPTLKKHFISKPRGLKIIKDGNEFFGFITRENAVNPAAPGQLMRLSFGSSLYNSPLIDSLGTFSAGTPAIGLNKIYTVQIFRNQASEHFLFGVGTANGALYRIGFKNPCAAERPIAVGDTVFNQSYTDKGKYFFSATGFDRNGEEVSGYDSVLVLQPVVASIGLEGNRCVGETISFKDSSLYDGVDPSLNKYHWDFGDANSVSDTSLAQYPTYAYSPAGLYSVKLKVEVSTGCVNQAERVVQIVGKPKVNFLYGLGGSVCTNDSILFSDNTTTDGDPIVSWDWQVKKDNLVIASSTRSNPKFLFSSIGLYQVSLRVKGLSNCDSSVVKMINVGNQGPLVSYSNPIPCLNETVPFSSNITYPAGVTADSLAWFLEGSEVSIQPNFSYLFSSTGFYSVRLVVHSAGCSNSYSKTFKVSEKPSFNITAPNTLQCQNLPLSFGVSGLTSTEQVKYLWNFGDATSDTIPNPTKTYSEAGDYTIELKIETDNGCATEKSIPFTTKPAPKALFSFDKSCKDEPVTWTNLSTANGIPGGITSFFWEFDDSPLFTTSTSASPPPLIYTNVDSVILVKLTVRTQAECPNTYVKKLQIGEKLNASFEKEIGCIGTPFRFYDKSRADLDPDPVVAWSWSIGGFPFSVKDPIVEFDLVGVFDVRLEVQSQGGCRASINATNEIVVNNPVQTDFTILDNSFTGEGPYRVRLDQTINPAYEYLWDFGDTTNSTAISPVHFYQKEGTYIISLKATRAGTICSTEVKKVVNVVVNPNVGIKVEKALAGTQNDNLFIGAELLNESNITLTALNLQAQLGNLVTLNEKWEGILLPSATLKYTFKSNIANLKSQNVPFVCVNASILAGFEEITPTNNSACVTVDTLYSLVSLYPVPATDYINFEANLPGTDPVELKIYDHLSHEIYNKRYEIDKGGVLKDRVSVAKYPPEIYYLRLKVGTGYERRKFIIAQ